MRFTNTITIPAITALISSILTGLLAVETAKESRATHLRLGSFSTMSQKLCITRYGKPFSFLTETFSTTGGDVSLRYSGYLLAKIGQTAITPTIESTIEFNPLGQLVAAVLIISLNQDQLKLGLLEANPIRVIVKTLIDDKNTEQEFKIPGPVVLSNVGDEIYEISHPLISEETLLPVREAVTTAGFNLVRDSSCVESSASLLDVTNDLQQLRGLAKKLPHLEFLPLINGATR